MPAKTIFCMKSQTELLEPSRNQLPGEQTLSPYRLYRTCDETPLSVFIKCVVDGDLSALIIEGSPAVEDLAEAWAMLYGEYLDLINSGEHKYVLSLQKEIAILDNEIQMIELCLYVLTIGYVEEIDEFLKTLDVYTDLDPLNPSYYQKIKAANDSLAQRRMELKIKTNEYQNYLKNNETRTEVTRRYFTKTLLDIAKHRGIATIKPANITVEEYAIMLEDLNNSHGKKG